MSEMTKERLDELDFWQSTASSALTLSKADLVNLVALAREGLRLREPPIDGDYLRQLHKEFDCGCETCARTAAVCPATASSLFQEVAILREHRDRLTAELEQLKKDELGTKVYAELDSLRKDKLGLEAASAAMEKQMERYRGFPQAHAVAECVGAIRTAIDSATRKESK